MFTIGETGCGVQGNSALSSQLFFKSKTVLNSKVYSKNKNKTKQKNAQ